MSEPTTTRPLSVWIDGAQVPADRATVSVFDRGFRNGEGVFETFRAYGDHVFRLDQHLARAVAGATELGFDPGPTAVLRAAVADTARANLTALDGQDSALRLTVSAGSIDPDAPFPGRPVGVPTVVVTSHRLAHDPQRTEVGVSASSVALARELPHVKAVSYLVAVTARRRARAQGCDEALLTSPSGEVLEGASSNLFAVVDGQLVTPPTEAGLLAGVTRAVVLEVAARLGLPVAARPLPVEELAGAEEAFLTATTREVVPLVRVDGAAVGTGRPGPVTGRIVAGFRALVEEERRAGSGLRRPDRQVAHDEPGEGDQHRGGHESGGGDDR
ncbi:aminotransferase class IV [Egicoccus halophilus]|uniref:Branched chain amino acid aminotransferase n=1 Tax=Egicoccus halophilus TaxID=1670830 RepID=A0A8J3AC90_9ACTN|nr:aminotransferase class IV [Egicoccus halophilus]GGI08222.1 branched chain amino acid aminotransferase [Egicoccus halophilus]